MSPTRLLRSLINRLDEIELYYRTTPDDYKITIFLEEAELALRFKSIPIAQKEQLPAKRATAWAVMRRRRKICAHALATRRPCS
jgi:hypothetical protein